MKPLDYDDGTIITAYQIIESFSNQIRDHYQPKEFENFLNNLSDDNNGNISLQMQLIHSFPMHHFSIPWKKGALGTNRLTEDHFLTLNYNHYRGHNVETSKIDFIENIFSFYKEKLLGSTVTKVLDLSQKDTLVELVPVFDLPRPISFD